MDGSKKKDEYYDDAGMGATNAEKAVGGTQTTFGPQVSSKRASAPCYGFGSGTRETQEKVFVLQEHATLVPPPSPAEASPSVVLLA